MTPKLKGGVPTSYHSDDILGFRAFVPGRVFFIPGNPGCPGMMHSVNIGPVIIPGVDLWPATTI